MIRHAIPARHVDIILRPENGSLQLDIADDGVGIPQPYVSGLGITSMRRRVEALGGTFTIAAQQAKGGTCIQATIPINP